MISLHRSYLEKQPIKMSVLLEEARLNMARMLILILQITMTNFVGIWLKIDFIIKAIVLVHIYLRFGCFQILLTY